jgi:ABC-type oligopeptide transport system substrate-binding subunit
MKKMLKIIATTALSVLACATLFACVPSNMEKAKTKMKKTKTIST